MGMMTAAGGVANREQVKAETDALEVTGAMLPQADPIADMHRAKTDPDNMRLINIS